MMATYAEVQALILNDIHRSDLTSAVQTAMSNARTKLQLDRYYFTETQSSFTVSTTALYDVATVLPNYLELDTVRVWYNGSPSSLRRMHWDTLADLDETLVTGLPSAWAVHHQMLRLYPTPDQSLAVEVSGAKSLSVSAWCSYAPTLVRAMAEVELYNLVLHDPAGAERAAQAVQIERTALLRRSPTMAASGEIRGYL